MALLRLLARTMLSSIFVLGGYSALTEPGGRAQAVGAVLPLPRPDLMVRLNGAAMVAGGAALALGIKPRLAAIGLAASLAPTTYVGHRFWAQSDPAIRRNHTIHFEKNLALVGGLLTYALTEDR